MATIMVYRTNSGGGIVKGCTHAGIDADYDEEEGTFTVDPAAISFAPAVGDFVILMGSDELPPLAVTDVSRGGDSDWVITAPAD
jgi:hypothetical protein